MPHVIGYDSLDDAFAAIARARATAVSMITDEMRASILDAEETVYVYRNVGGLHIWGEVFTLDETVAEEGRYTGDPAELEAIAAAMRENRGDGYLFGRWYSVVEPEGELGDGHVVTVVRVPRGQFEEARRRGWDWEPS